MITFLPSSSIKINEDYEKLQTYEILYKLGCPVLNSVIMTTREDLKNLGKIKEYLKSDYGILRFQYVKPCKTPIAGGRKVRLAYEELNSQYSEDYIMWFLEENDKLKNLYSININYSYHLNSIIYEIVGRGFDSSDLNRGRINPHQIIIEENYNFPYLYKEFWKGVKNQIITTEAFEESKAARVEYLNKNNYNLETLSFDDNYKPIPLSLLEQIREHGKNVFEFFEFKEDISISCCVLDSNQLVFWDIQTASNKLKRYR